MSAQSILLKNDEFVLANNSSAIETVGISSVRYTVMPFTLSVSFILSTVFILGFLLTLQFKDTGITKTSFIIIAVFSLLFLAVLFWAYLSFLKNVGEYVYRRTKPIVFQ